MNYRLICWFLILFACFFGLGSYPLLDDNEGLYGSMARDMLASGQFIIPHLNGVPYIEKPPLLYWLMAASMSAFGVNEGAARLPMALALFATACCIKRFIQRQLKSEPAAFTAALLLVTSLPMLVMARMILCDMIMTCLLTIALLQFYQWHTGQSKNGLRLFYAALALAVLAKGLLPIALAGGMMAVFLIWERAPLKQFLRVLNPTGILIFFIIAAPWHIAACLKEDGFAWYYFVNEHLYRFLDKRVPHDYYTGPIWYYLPRIIGYLLPWSLFLLLLPVRARSEETVAPSLRCFLWSWFLFCLIFFSLAGGKANYYMITGMPPLVMLLALQIKSYADAYGWHIKSLACGSTAVVMVILWLVYFFCTGATGWLGDQCEIFSWPNIGFAAIYAAISSFMCWRLSPRWLAPLLSANIIFMLPMLVYGSIVAGGRVSQWEVADYLNKQGAENPAIYQEYEHLSALGFYIKNPLTIVDSQSADLLYGQRYATDSTFITLSYWASQKPRQKLVVPKQKVDNLFTALRDIGVDLNSVCIEQRLTRVVVIGKCPPHISLPLKGIQNGRQTEK